MKTVWRLLTLVSVAIAISATAVAVWAGNGRDRTRPLTFAERVSAQQALERVSARNRRPLSTGVESAPPARVVERKAADALQQSLALELLAGETITPGDLQNEIVRLTRRTRAPARLGELFRALEDDPYLIAECLARPLLAHRRLRAWFCSASGLHEDARERAEALRDQPLGEDPQAGAGYVVQDVVLAARVTGHGPGAPPSDDPAVVEVTPAELALLAESLPAIGAAGPVEESATDFRFVRTMAVAEGLVRLRFVVVPKRGFSQWWSETREIMPAAESVEPAPVDFPFFVPAKSVSASPEDRWTEISTDGAPSGRYVPSVVWTGNEVIVWGGSSPPTDTGGRYYPATDSWADTSLSDVPDARTSHTAVWTGTEMIVWGGWDGAGLLAVGGKYDPVGDTWAPTAAPPTGVTLRRRHRAVWTGTEMVVWGGWDGADHLATGGKYDPAGDEWSPTEALEALAGRYSHTAVWTGTEMIVWGGQSDGGEYPSTGGRYAIGDPDVWTATTEDGAPAGRSNFVGVWSGSELIVWGGWFSGAPTSTGGAYSPETGQWRATTDVNAPTAGEASPPAARPWPQAAVTSPTRPSSRTASSPATCPRGATDLTASGHEGPETVVESS